MPCDSAYLNHTDKERESGKVLEFLKEVNGEYFDHDNPSYYGNILTLNQDTERLCSWMKAHPDQLPTLSLELQLWWKQHQKHDAVRERKAREMERDQKLREKAVKKLSKEERHALGLDWIKRG